MHLSHLLLTIANAIKTISENLLVNPWIDTRDTNMFLYKYF